MRKKALPANRVLCEINTALGYNYEENEFPFEMLTHTRYDNKAMASPLKASYFVSADKTKVYKMTIVEVDQEELPAKEKEALAELAEDEGDDGEGIEVEALSALDILRQIRGEAD